MPCVCTVWYFDISATIVCCCCDFRIPRTRQEIEESYKKRVDNSNYIKYLDQLPQNVLKNRPKGKHTFVKSFWRKTLRPLCILLIEGAKNFWKKKSFRRRNIFICPPNNIFQTKVMSRDVFLGNTWCYFQNNPVQPRIWNGRPLSDIETTRLSGWLIADTATRFIRRKSFLFKSWKNMKWTFITALIKWLTKPPLFSKDVSTFASVLRIFQHVECLIELNCIGRLLVSLILSVIWML